MLFRVGEPALQPADFAAPIGGRRDRRALVGALQLVGCLSRLFERSGPVAFELHDLGAVHQTLAVEGAGLRVARAPGGQLGGPFARAHHLLDPAAGRDDVAVDYCADQRREVAVGRQQHGLVDRYEAVGDAPEPEQHAALQASGQRDQVGLTGTLPHRDGAVRGVEGGIEGALGAVHLDLRQQQVSSLRAVRRRLLSMSAGTLKPARAPADLADHHQPQAGPECGASRPDIVVQRGAMRMETPEGGEHVLIPAGNGRGPAQRLDVAGRERGDGIGEQEHVRRVRPRTVRVGSPGLLPHLASCGSHSPIIPSLRRGPQIQARHRGPLANDLSERCPPTGLCCTAC